MTVHLPQIMRFGELYFELDCSWADPASPEYCPALWRCFKTLANDTLIWLYIFRARKPRKFVLMWELI